MAEVDEEQRRIERAHDRIDAEVDAINQATIQTGQLAAKALIAINGGAAVAILAFVGNLSGKGVRAGVGIADALGCFALGVAMGAVCLGVAFVANYLTAASYEHVDKSEDIPYATLIESGERPRKWARRAQFVSFGSGVSALTLFLVGVFLVRRGLINTFAQ